jgi:drug/metabolite transporter (DMT)-like permease
MYLIIKWKHLNMFGPKEMRFSLLMRGSIGVVGLMSMHFAVKFIDPSDSQAIFNTSLLLTAINARIFLGEKLNLGHIVSLILTCVGVVFISQPKFLFGSAISINSTMTTINATANNSSISNDDGSAINRVTGIGLAMAGAAAAAIVPIIIKHLANHKVHFSVMIIYASYFGIPASVFISFLYAVVLNKPFSERLKLIDNRTDLILWDVFYSIMSAITGLAQQIFWNLTIKYEDASRSAVLRSLNIVFVFFLQYIFLNIKSNLFSIIGAILILFGTIFIITFKILDSKYSIKKEQKQPNTIAECEKNYDDDEEKSGLLMRKLIFYKI